MGALSEFFFATPTALESAFAGWGGVSPTPVQLPASTVRNPFTGQAVSFPPRLGWAADPHRPCAQDARAPDLAAFDVLPLKGIDGGALAMLCEAVLGDAPDRARLDCFWPGLVPPANEISRSLTLVPERVVDLFAAQRPARTETAASWEAAFLASIETIPNAAARKYHRERWTGAFDSIVEAFADITGKRRPGERLYLLVSL